MFANGYVGSSEDSQRIRKLDKQREAQRKKFEELQDKKRNEAAGLRQFGSSKSEAYEAAFKNETVGLVTRQEFIEKRNTIQERLEEDELKERLEAEAAAAAEKERKRKEKEKKKAKAKLSFAADEDEEDAQEAEPVAAGPSKRAASGSSGDEPPSTSGVAAPVDSDAGPAIKRPKFSKLGKDPGVQTNFLPDKDRELEEEELKKKLKEEWRLKQEAIKNEPLEIVYSYWDGSGHRRKVTVRKGDTIGVFLKAVREQLAPQFRELRAISVDNLMYIKEDLILPHHFSFYDLIVNKARGKSGPLFDFGVNLDIRILHDATQENQDVHAGKVVERHWYERNKHIFPASRWEIFDPEADYGDKYTIKG